MNDMHHARLESRILQALSHLLLYGQIKDFRVNSLCSFTYIRLAKDCTTATIGVSAIDTSVRILSAVQGFNSAAGYLQYRLQKIVHTRNTPKLHFVADYSIAEGQDVINTLDSMKKEI